MEVPTTRGSCWFKTTAPLMANDAGLSPILAAAAPDLLVTPLAADPARRWMLLPDGGARLRDVADERTLLEHWERILPRYAELQLALTGREAELLAAGALDHRPERLPALLRDALGEEAWLRVDAPDGLSGDQLAALRGLAPRLVGAAQELAGAGIGPSIQHDDLHDGNVLVADDADRIVDWGDAGLAHPFGTLLVTLRSVADALSLAEDAPELLRLRDAYLEPFTASATPSRLRELVRLATWTGILGRVAIWRAALRHAGPGELDAWKTAVPEWLAELLATTPA